MKKPFALVLLVGALIAGAHADPLRLYVTDYYGAGDGAVKMYDGTTGAYLSDFVTPGSGGLNHASGIRFGPDGDLYVGSVGTSSIKKYDGTTGAYLADFATGNGLDTPLEITFGPDGNLYVGTFGSGNQIKKFNGVTGAFMGDFLSGGTIASPYQILFGADGDAYVSMYRSNSIARYNGATGAFIDNFVPSGSGGLSDPTGIIFSSDGGLLVSSDDGRILKYDGATGAYLGTFAREDAANVMTNPGDLHFGPNGELLVCHGATNTIKRFSSTVPDDFLGDYFPSGSGGIVYNQDFVFNQNFAAGPCPVPEPPAFLSLLFGTLAVTCYRRRSARTFIK